MKGLPGGPLFWNPFIDNITVIITDDHKRLKRARILKEDYEQMIKKNKPFTMCSGCQHYHSNMSVVVCTVCGESFCERFDTCKFNDCACCKQCHCAADGWKCSQCQRIVCVDCIEGLVCINCDGVYAYSEEVSSDESSSYSEESDSDPGSPSQSNSE